MPIRAYAVPHALPRTHNQPTENCEQQRNQVPFSSPRVRPTEDVEENQRRVEDEEKEVYESEHIGIR